MNAPSQLRTRERDSKGRPTSLASIFGPLTVDAAFEDQTFILHAASKKAESEANAPVSDQGPLLGNFAKQLTALKAQEARLRELLRTSRKR